MKTIKTAALEMIDKAVGAINTVQVHLLETHDDGVASLALDAAIAEIEGVSAIVSFDFKGFESVPEPIKQRITELNKPVYSESFMSEFFESLGASGEWTCDSNVFDSAFQRFKQSQFKSA